MIDRPLRGALQSIADPLQVNVWLDRGLDPTVLVSTAADTKTGFEAISALAQSAGANVAVVDNMVLVGRAAWVEQTAGALLCAPLSGIVKDIRWPDLTTPTDAALRCGADAARSLPHDLWPAVVWSQVDTSIAHLLVAAQFNQMPSVSAQGYVPLQSPAKISALYPFGHHSKSLRSAVTKADNQATIKELDSQLMVSGSAAAHLAAINAWLGQSDLGMPAPININKVKFSLRLQNTTAEKVFRQLATAAGRRLVIEPDAEALCQQLVSFAAAEQSLRELCDTVAAAANVSVAWTDSDLTISVPK